MDSIFELNLSKKSSKTLRGFLEKKNFSILYTFKYCLYRHDRIYLKKRECIKYRESKLALNSRSLIYYD